MFCQKLKKLQFSSIFNNLLPKGHQNYSCVKLSVPIIEKNLGWNISLLIRCYINGWTQIQTQGLGLPPFACGRRKKFWCWLLVTPGRGLRLIPGRCWMVARMEERTRMTFLHPWILVREQLNSWKNNMKKVQQNVNNGSTKLIYPSSVLSPDCLCTPKHLLHPLSPMILSLFSNLSAIWDLNKSSPALHYIYKYWSIAYDYSFIV